MFQNNAKRELTLFNRAVEFEGRWILKIHLFIALEETMFAGFRAGLIDNTFGMGVDFDIPFPNEKLRWITSLEAYDFKGRNIWNERVAHLKWINKVYFLRNVYFVFGADNFISKKDASGYWGGGIRFEDDDLKYLLSKVGLAGVGGSS